MKHMNVLIRTAGARLSRTKMRLRGLALLIVALSAGCALAGKGPGGANDTVAVNMPDKFLESGTIILAHRVPDRLETLESVASAKDVQTTQTEMAPLVGYFPASAAFVPADNEHWLEIDRERRVVSLHKGKEQVREVQAEGEVSLEPGEYHLQHKQAEPLWYAPNQYFTKRQLAVPPSGDRLRYRRGALGRYAMYPTTTFSIHSAAVWTDDVGGLRVPLNDLTALFEQLPVGAPVVVK